MNSLVLAFILYLLYNVASNLYYAGKGKVEFSFGKGSLMLTAFAYGGIALFLLVTSS